MFKINRKLEYALIALKHMSHFNNEKLTSAKEICDVYHTPFDPMSRVLQLMAQKGILKAEHGAYGGYQIATDLSNVTLNDLTEIIVGPLEIANCFHGNYSRCELTTSCNVIAPMLNINERIYELFKTIKVTELFSSVHNREKKIRLKPIEL